MESEGLVCPHCEKDYSDDCDTYTNHTTYWGNVEQVEQCGNCGKKFMVEEIVTREWETRKVEDSDDA